MASIPEIPGFPEDAPDVLGDMLIKAIKERNASLMNNLLRRNLFFGTYAKKLTKEEQQWAFENIEQ